MREQRCLSTEYEGAKMKSKCSKGYVQTIEATMSNHGRLLIEADGGFANAKDHSW
jgi:hypothetical protein